MTKHSIILKRDGIEGFLSIQSLGTDAINAMVSITGVKNVHIINETDEQVELTYEWVGESTFWDTESSLLKFGLSRVLK